MKKYLYLSLSYLAVLFFLSCSKSDSQKQKENSSETYARSLSKTWGNYRGLDTTQIQTDQNGSRFIKDVVLLTSDEASKLQSLIAKVSSSVQKDFTAKQKSMLEKLQSPEISISSNSDTYKNTQEFQEFYSFCNDQGKDGLALFTGILFNDVSALDGVILVAFDLYRVKYATLYQQVQSEVRLNQYNANGFYIMYSDLSIARRLAKKILAGL